MGTFNLLTSNPPISLFGNTYDISLNWLGQLIRMLIEGIGVIGIGIIVFSILLRVIVLPADIYQRVAMRKQNIKMEENKAKLEKLQKQYANDKDMYNQKMMEMYKENGISMFSSCLPAILSLIVFIVAINAFNAFSQYANLQNYNLMVEAYNGALTPHCASVENIREDDTMSITLTSDGTLEIRESGEDKYIYYVVVYDSAYQEDNYAYIKNATKTYYVDVDKLYTNNADESVKGAIDGYRNEIVAGLEEGSDKTEETILQDACLRYLRSNAQDAVKTTYDDVIVHRTKFLWIKNIWATDASYKNPVYKKYSDFSSACLGGKFRLSDGSKVKYATIDGLTDAYREESYETITAKLTAEKSQANGYYILILLSIGTILLQQLVTMRSQKAQNQYSTVDGQGGSNQKMMLIVMTLMFAIFSFMYSSAFSLYMITGNILSLLMTLTVNKIVEKVMDKKEAEKMQAQYNNRFPGRTYASDKSDKNARKNQSAQKSSGEKKNKK